MKWNTLSVDETGINYRDSRSQKCSKCGAPFLESELQDIIFFPDLGSDSALQEIGQLREQGIDLSDETAAVCISCRIEIDEMLRRNHS